MPDDALPALADRMQALASPTRLRILLVLRDGALSVCQIAAVLDVPASTISSHLADLRKAGIVGEHRRGRFVWYALHRRADAVPWLRLVARQLADDPVVVADHGRAARIRLVPPEMLVASIQCDAGVEPETRRRHVHARGVA
jgi:ArsR family transcriptional regulator